MTRSNDEVRAISGTIYGWLDPRETDLLYQQALGIPAGGVIVEVGSYQGRSTSVFGIAAKERGGKVYAVDHYRNNPGVLVVTPEDFEKLRANLERLGLTDTVEIVVSESVDAAAKFEGEIDLLFLDGSHQYEDVKADLAAWAPKVRGKIAMHDTSGNWPGVSKALEEFLAEGDWSVTERADATSVLERAKPFNNNWPDNQEEKAKYNYQADVHGTNVPRAKSKKGAK
jgi:precorrin-6B methylase 2